MKWLIQIAFKEKKRLILVFFAAVAMILATLSSQAEMLSLGFLNTKSIDVFELFADPKSPDQISKGEFDRRFNEIDEQNRGSITRDEIAKFSSKKEKKRGLAALMGRFRAVFETSGGGSRLILLFIFISSFRALATFAQNYLGGKIYLQIWQELCQNYFDKLQQMPLQYHAHQSIGALVSRISHDAADCAGAVNSLMTNYWQTPLLVISSLGYLYFMSPALFALVFFELPLLGLIIFYFTRKIRKAVSQTRSQRESTSSLLVEFLSGIQAIKMFAAEGFASDRYKVANDKMIGLELRSLRYHMLLRPMVHFLCTLFFVGIILWGVSRAHIEMGELLSYCGLIYLIYEQVKKIADENASIQKGVVAAERLFELINAKPHVDDDLNAPDLPLFSNQLVLRNVSFRFLEGNDVLQKVNLVIKRGSFVALTGPTGAGKSTLIQLISRLYDPTEGLIEIDGFDLRRIAQKSLRQQIAFVPQKPFLLSDTISANIAFGRDISQERIEWACRQAHADTFIQSLAQGYQTKLSEMGNSLSGGQQQRLAIARALAGDARILILDEATSALDAVTEQLIRKTLQALRGSVTLIVIAHRLSTIEEADQIFFLQSGQLIDRGTCQELIKSCLAFRQIWEAMRLSDQDSAN